MESRWRALVGGGLVVCIFLFVQLAAIGLVQPFMDAGLQAVEDPQDPTNSLVYVLAILVATVVMLAAFRYGIDELVRALVILAGVWLSLYLFRVLIPPVVTVPVPGLGSVHAVAWALAAVLGLALYVYPEWYVIDAAGAIMGAAAAGLFGISFGIFPAILLLVVLAVYDAISVYGTEHMLTLATGVMDLKIPVVLVIPTTTSFSFIDADAPDPKNRPSGADDGSNVERTPEDGDAKRPPEDGDANGGAADDVDPLEREALYIGLGDAVIPTVLVASAAVFVPATVPTVAGIPVAALTAIVGTLVGLLILLWMVFQGRAHAGLPLLNGGAIGGYLVGALAGGLTVVEALGIAQYL